MKMVAGTFAASSELGQPARNPLEVAEVLHLVHSGSVVDRDRHAARMHRAVCAIPRTSAASVTRKPYEVFRILQPSRKNYIARGYGRVSDRSCDRQRID